MIRIFFMIFISSSILVACQTSVNHQQDWKKYFDRYGVNGAFLVHDIQTDTYFEYNPSRLDSAYVPASTFKIIHSLIALETGIVQSVDDTIQWDGQIRNNPDWDQDLTLRDAFRYSAVWVYQDIAPRIGTEKMSSYLDQTKYGNATLRGAPIDQFWLRGNLAISAREQIDFLEKLYYRKLPFQTQHQQLVKELMRYEEKPGFTLFAKSGWSNYSTPGIGWFVGFLESKDHIYFFAMNLDITKPNQAAARYSITKNILLDMGIIPSPEVH